jgi:hypothetical protein
MQHALKPAAGAAGTEVVPSELLDELLLSAPDGTLAALHVGFGGESSAALASALERTRSGRSE